MGSTNPDFPDAQPVHTVKLLGFWIDRNEVTNAEFAKFVGKTGYVTTAERKPDFRDFPGADPSLRVPGSLVFVPPDHQVNLRDPLQWWRFVPGASWRHPEGPASSIIGKDEYPVVQVSFDDAVAFAKWSGARLPTEAEFEYAARGGLQEKRYAWGDELRPHGRWMANTFNGRFPYRNLGVDGFTGLAPIHVFPPNGYGLFDMAGNVWEWCSDRYRPDAYARKPARNATAEVPEARFYVQRGGSFLCSDEYCARYEVGSRGKGEESTSTNHAGFRCVISSAR